MFTSIVLAAAGAVTKFRLHINAEKPDEPGSGTNHNTGPLDLENKIRLEPDPPPCVT
jgi:hypothetical protein